MSVIQQWASEDTDTVIELPLTSLGAMKIMLTGSDGRAITGFEVQGLTLLFQSGTVTADETITVTVSDPSGAYGTATASVALDSNRLGSPELTMTQKGSFVFGGVSGPDANLLVFDSVGSCIQTSSAVPGLSSGVMEPGTYPVVLIQKSELLRGVSALSYLRTFELIDGKDYLLRQITIADGKITRLDNCTVPSLDESRIPYTIADNTSVTTNRPSGIAVGDLLPVRAAYVLDKTKGMSADSLQIVLPDGISPLETSVLIDNETATYTYNQTKREVCINMNGRDKAVVWLYCTPVKSGSHSISALLTLMNGASQPIGATVVQAEDACLEVPERTGTAEGIIVSGKTRPGSTVKLYDYDELVGSTTANAAGSWSISFNLLQPVYSYSYHNIHAVMTGGNLSESITTKSVLVTYDKRLEVSLTKITTYNTGDHGAQETVFDFTSNASTAVPYYRMWPSRYTTFTFKAEFSEDASNLSEVYVVTTNSAGDKTYVETKYDATSGAWVGTRDYTSFNDAPVTVTAAYTYGFAGDVPVDREILEATTNSFLEASRDVMTVLDAELYDVYDCTELSINENSVSTRLTYTDPETDNTQEFGTYSMEVAQLEDEVTEKELTDRDFTFIEDTQL